ncbi:MAG: hypothetical protein PHY92_05045 [Alphaproteobacteria bacterium]|nr:hypothetical protein [Alphaproteobacteria bacterium]
MTINKHAKQTGLVVLAALAMWGDFAWLVSGYNRPLAIAGAVLFVALGLFILFMAGRLFVFLLKTCPAQLTAVGVWIIVSIHAILLSAILAHM